jgi:hypothetical protein
MLKPKSGTTWLDFHPGGVPAGIIFDQQVTDLCEIANTSPTPGNEISSELAFIGLIAYFEGFCKNHTAAILNICPQIIHALAERGRELKLRAVDIFEYTETLNTQFGSLVLENVEFGTAKAINGLYHDLLGITPFSKRESKTFHALLEDRHLIVHHGNVYTPNYAHERFIRREIGRTRIYFDSLKVTAVDVRRAARFLHELSLKLRDSSLKALKAYVVRNHLRLAKPNREAVEALSTAMPEAEVWQEISVP